MEKPLNLLSPVIQMVILSFITLIRISFQNTTKFAISVVSWLIEESCLVEHDSWGFKVAFVASSQGPRRKLLPMWESASLFQIPSKSCEKYWKLSRVEANYIYLIFYKYCVTRLNCFFPDFSNLSGKPSP